MVLKRFYFSFINKDMLKAAQNAENLLHPSSKMMRDIGYKLEWKYETKLTGSDLALELVKYRDPILVSIYKPILHWSKAIAYYQDGKIYFNKYKIDSMSVSQLTGTLLHEYAHYCGFSHGSNLKTQEKVKYSVPYYISENVDIWLESASK